jgi:hypothetical protein
MHQSRDFGSARLEGRKCESVDNDSSAGIEGLLCCRLTLNVNLMKGVLKSLGGDSPIARHHVRILFMNW